jgi:hypothetical protein
MHLHIFLIGFFEDSIHSTRSSNTQGGVLQYKHICSLDFGMSRHPPHQRVARRAPTELLHPYTAAPLQWVPRMYKNQAMDE